MKESAKLAETSAGWRWFRNLSIFAALLVLYFASAIFFAMMVRRGQIPDKSHALAVIQFVYAPVEWLHDNNKTFAKTFMACVDFFCPEDDTPTK